MLMNQKIVLRLIPFTEYHIRQGYHISLVIRWRFFLPKECQKLDPSHKMDLDLWDCLER